MKTQFDPEPMFPNFLVPRPTKLTGEESAMVKYYKSLRNKILEETPFYVLGVKRRVEEDDEDGMVPGSLCRRSREDEARMEGCWGECMEQD